MNDHRKTRGPRVSVSEIITFIGRCQRFVAARRLYRVEAKNVGGELGRASHAAAAGENRKKVRSEANKKLKELGVVDKKQRQKKAKDAVERGVHSSNNVSRKAKKEKQLYWLNAASGLTVCARPDAIEPGEIVNIIEKKFTGGRPLDNMDWYEVMLFALVYSMLENVGNVSDDTADGADPDQIVIQITLRNELPDKTSRDESRWLSRKNIKDGLLALEKILLNMAAAMDAGIFTETPGPHCARCPLTLLRPVDDVCEAGQREVAWRANNGPVRGGRARR